MKKILIMVGVMILSSQLLWAGNLKIATVNLAKLFNAYPGTTIAKQKLKAITHEKEKELSGLQAKLLQMMQSLKSKESVLPASEVKKREAAIEAKREEYLTDQSTIENELTQEENVMTQNVIKQISKIVSKVAVAHHVDLVLDSAKVLYLKNPINLTQDVLNEFANLSVLGQ
jgi:Skp family chaperone for outer membrane proteins